MALDDRLGKKVLKAARREEASGIRVDPYPYIGIVKNNLDPTRSGRLQVYIPDLGGPEDDPSNWRTVSYASPFMGYTPQTTTSTERPSKENKFSTVHHTYGMWFVPPDIGVQVIVLFIAGDPLRGYWLACVNPHLSHYMVPGLAGTQNIDKTSVPGNGANIKDGEILPAAEFNEYTKDFTNTSFYNNNKPVHTFQWDIYKKQGLDKDFVRGPLSSSSQRESPSFVFGISTPGRPVNDPAEDKNYLTNLKSGKVDPKYLTTKSRKGGHVFLMDDGATMGEDQLIRLRTAGGHQILMHDTNETLYIAHGTGKSWIELAKDGSILIYSDSGVALRTQGDMDLKADGNFNLDVGGKINVRSGDSLNVESSAMNILADSKFCVTANSGMELKVGAFKLDSAAKISLKAGGVIAVEGGVAKIQSGGTDNVQAIKPMQTVQLPDTLPAGPIWAPRANAQKTIVGVAPTHEPYNRGTTGRAFIPQSPGIQPRSFSGSSDLTKDQSVTQAGVKNPAGLKDLRNQPEATDTVGNLSKDQMTAYLAQIGQSESGGVYNTTNQIGYVGKYQFGYMALIDGGYVKSTVESNAELQNPNSWTGKNGITSVEAWLANGSEQEAAMLAYTKQNYTTMVNNGAVTSDQSPEDVAGMLAVSHLLGAGGANTWRTSGSGADANGTTGSVYFNKGKYAVAVLAPQLPAVNAG